jgi:carboxylesterase type B
MSETDESRLTFEHPTLGPFTGFVDSSKPECADVVQFRAIPYARIPVENGRLKHSKLLQTTNGPGRGYASPHNFSMDDINGGGPIPGEAPIQTLESGCLMLQVNVPISHISKLSKEAKGAEKLPVMAYIHGGGFVLGKIDAQHNTASMVQHSINIGQPIIGVNIQYRLGALGFMATPDGRKNFGLWDQRNALLWIQKFIEGFGGDKNRNTLFGESAGSYSICCHMLSHPPSSGPLFNRAILQSGVIGPMMTPRTEEKAAEAFKFICEELGVEEKGEAAVDRLRGFPTQKLVDASEKWTNAGNSWGPVEDEEFFGEKITWDRGPELLGKCEWVDEVIVGNTGFEGQAFDSVANSMTPARFIEHLKLELGTAAADLVMRAYNISEGMDQNLLLTSVMRWCGDVIFDGKRPTMHFANTFQLPPTNACTATSSTSATPSRKHLSTNKRTTG